MKVRGSRTNVEYVDVEVSTSDMLKALRAAYAKKIKIPEDAYIKDGWWWWDEEVHTSHAWTEYHKIREATETETAVWQGFAAITKELK